MAAKKTSAEKAREDAENARVENMLDGAFGTLSGLETNKVAEQESEEKVDEEVIVNESDGNQENLEARANEEVVEDEIENSTVEDDLSEEEDQMAETSDSSPVDSPPKGPPSSPPSGPPSKGPPSKPPSGPPSKGPPSKPPSGPPSKGPPSKPPSGPPSKGPPSKPPSGPPSKDSPSDLPSKSSPEEITDDELIKQTHENDSQNIEDVTEIDNQQTIEDNNEKTSEDEKTEDEVNEDDSAVEVDLEPTNIETEDEISSEDDVPSTVSDTDMMDSPETEEGVTEEESSVEADPESTNIETEAEIARLSAEVERLRKSMAGAAEVIEELENPPMPPAVMDDLVIGAHIVGDMARLARQLDREQLIRASMGAIAMLHPEQLEIIISTKHMALLPRMDERDICAAKLGVSPPRGAPEEWRVLEVVLASVSLITGGPAAVIHSHGPFTTAASCEKDLVLVQPIDEIGKKHIGKIIIVDPDDDNPEEFLRQVAEALQQGGMRCVVIRGKGAYAVGADLDQAWANAAMLEHSMKVVLLARQANLKV